MLERNQIDIASASVVELKRIINDWLFYFTDGVVQSGPFKGLKIQKERSWDDGNIGTELLGCYEQELHGFIEEEIARLAKMASPIIVNIGCAEGYYTNGLAYRLKDALVCSIDKDENAIDIARGNAAINHVGNRIAFGTVPDLASAMGGAIDLVVCDCEGGEVEYLDLEKYPTLAKATVLVECHDFGVNVTQLIADRFKATHDIWLVNEGGRDPNQFEFLRGWHSHARWLAVSEGRPFFMHWLILRPR